MKNTIQNIEEAEAKQSAFELSMVDSDIFDVLKDLPPNSIAREYPIRLQAVKSLKEIIALLRTLIEQTKKSDENARNSSDGQNDI